jgi:hypothetical protein
MARPAPWQAEFFRCDETRQASLNYGLTNPDGVISTVVVLLLNEPRALC